MSRLYENPMYGPAYFLNLRAAIERRPKSSVVQTPPRTGGPQISMRLSDLSRNHVEVIAEKSGWNRSEVIDALVQRGLYDLYEGWDPKIVDSIVKEVIARVAPPHPPAKI